MARVPAWRRYLRFFGPNVDGDVDDELRFHLDARIAEYEQTGMTRAEAERAARERLGDLASVEQHLRAHDQKRAHRTRVAGQLDLLAQDFRIAARGLRRSPTFTATTVLTLTIGIGLAVAMFTLFRVVLIQRLPVADQDHIVVLWTENTKDTEYTIGAALGLVGALVTTRLYGALLFEVSPNDPASLVGACVLLIGVGVAAAYLPARRATRIDPVSALRAD